jgi:6-phosphogluconolactonase/glucosamine-6-phosphate isomerase/deaminase
VPQLKFIKTDSPIKVSDYLVKSITAHLNRGDKVLWLVAGGSAIDIAVQTAKELKDNPNISGLAVSLTDERYGESDHPGSNWQQLIDKGFQLPGARLLPVLNGENFEATAKRYSDFLNTELDTADFSIALAGMGADGHVFGIKPHSPAVDSSYDVVAYDWDDYRRLTPTCKLIKRLDEVIVYAAGAEKHHQFDDLEKNLATQNQPAQLLKSLHNVTIFNDYVGTTGDKV